MTTRSHTWLRPLAMLIAACGGSGADSGSDCETLSAVVGVGEFAYEPFEEGGLVTMVHGPQGGWHIDLAGEVSGTTGSLLFTPSIVEQSQQVQLGGQGQAEEAHKLVGWSAETCAGSFFKLRVFLDDVDPGGPMQRFICTLKDNVFEVSLEIQDTRTGETVSEGFSAVAAIDPGDKSICSTY